MSEFRLPEVKMNLVKPPAPVTARVVSNELCLQGKSASFVKHLVLDIGGTPLAGNFAAGQSFGVIPPGVDDRGKPHKVRLYSIACPTWGEDGDAQIFSTTPKRLIEEFTPQKKTDDPDNHELFLGVCSNYLCDLKAGDPVQLTGPNGRRFLLPLNPDGHDYLFLATGTGIAPFRGMVLELLERRPDPCTSQVDLVMGAPYATDLLYDDLFSRLAEQHDNFHYHTAISREASGSAGGMYVDGLLGANMDYFGPRLADPRTLIYLCGLSGMREGLCRTLASNGLDAGYLQIDPSLNKAPADWNSADIRHNIRPTARCLIEVY